MMSSCNTPEGPANVLAIALAFANALNRERDLTEWESGLVAVLVAKGRQRTPLRRWTPAQDDQLSRLTRGGLTAAEIGSRVGRSTDAIHTRIKRLKIKDGNNG